MTVSIVICLLSGGKVKDLILGCPPSDPLAMVSLRLKRVLTKPITILDFDGENRREIVPWRRHIPCSRLARKSSNVTVDKNQDHFGSDFLTDEIQKSIVFDFIFFTGLLIFRFQIRIVCVVRGRKWFLFTFDHQVLCGRPSLTHDAVTTQRYLTLNSFLSSFC